MVSSDVNRDSLHDPAGVLERITATMSSSLDLHDVLAAITDGLVNQLGAALARIWLIGPGDLCSGCHKLSSCRHRERCLHLRASSGLSTNLDGEFRRVPLGELKIGRIAQGTGPLVSPDVLSDDRLPNKEWIRENELQSFAGWPLIFREELLGVIALFSRRRMDASEFERLEVFANQAAIAIKNAQLFSQVNDLNRRLQAENVYLREEIHEDHGFDYIIGKSAVLRRVLRKIEQVAPTDTTVLLLGETGTGKEILARAIHERSQRKGRSLIRVNCAALSPQLVESELFGHAKGAFTGATQKRVGRFELADGGTIFLDEIGELPADTQVKLLRVLQEREFERVGESEPVKVDVRVIAATHRDLNSDVKDGTLRADLFYRLNVFPVEVPPLRERRTDIPLLSHFFLDRLAARLNKRLDGIESDSMDRLMNYAWPGNIRELQNIIERAAILSTGGVLRIDDRLDAGGVDVESDAHSTLADAERAHIQRVLTNTGWVIEGKKGAAQILGIQPNTLRSRMQKLSIKKSPNTA